jgi:uncharacterized membrane protein YkvA (DUF1232 family)
MKQSQLLGGDVYAVYLAARDARTPWYAKALAISIAAYALSPIDLIPDFIPVLGFLDDLIIVPLGIAAIMWASGLSAQRGGQQEQHAKRKERKTRPV